LGDGRDFIWAMMSALLAAALWLNLATWVGAPVSTTHSIVGGVMGAGIAAAGFMAVNWPMMGRIAASWVMSPVLGGIIAAAVSGLHQGASSVCRRQDRRRARWVPVLVAIMAGAFSAYLALKGLSRSGQDRHWHRGADRAWRWAWRHGPSAGRWCGASPRGWRTARNRSRNCSRCR
jgi:inorganic phosphate transporter, PiT family